MYRIYKISFFSFLIFFAISLQAQDKTTGRQNTLITESDARILVIPYEPKMFISDVSRELTYANNMEINEIRVLLRESLSQMISNELAMKSKVIDLLNDGDPQQAKDIFEIYEAVNWEYIPVEVPDSVKNKKGNESKQQIGRGTFVEDGMIKTYYDGKDRFMNVKIEDKNILGYIEKRYDADFILFLNELDIRVRRDVESAPGRPAPRQVKVHYSLLDKQGKKISASALMFDYPGDQKDIFKIIRSGFSQIAKDLRKSMFPTAVSSGNTGVGTKK